MIPVTGQIVHGGVPTSGDQHWKWTSPDELQFTSVQCWFDSVPLALARPKQVFFEPTSVSYNILAACEPRAVHPLASSADWLLISDGTAGNPATG